MDQEQARLALLNYLDRGSEGTIDCAVIESLLLDTQTILPDQGCDLVGIERGSSYAHAVTELLLHWHESAD